MSVKKQQDICVLIGAGYTGKALIPHLLARGMKVYATTRRESSLTALTKLGASALLYNSQSPKELISCLKSATHIITSVPPSTAGDPVINDLGTDISNIAPRLKWAGYLSATSVYGDRKGQWAFEDEMLRPITARGRRRILAELAWLETGAPVHIFRLAGIYGAGRSPFNKIKNGTARAVIKAGHIVNRIHVEDICSALLASMDAPDPTQIYNIADGHPAPPQEVLDYAADIIGAARAPRISHDDAVISDMARSFYVETKSINIDRAVKKLGWSPKYANFQEGLSAAALDEKVTAAGVVITGYIDIAQNDLGAVTKALPEHIRLTQDEPGCKLFHVTQDSAIPTRYHLYERFDSPAAFKAHQSRTAKSAWASASRNAKRHYNIYGLE